MRIIHYWKLIDQEETQEFSLRNCPVVIDGQNHLHFMYEKSRIPFIFGSETDKYADVLKKRFKMFKDANIKCYILFKGGDSDIEKKINKFQQTFFDFDDNCIFVPPIFLKDATAQVIDEMEFDYAFCVTETKDDCVALAQKLKCPVVTFDIEYCFRKAPYVPSSTMKFDDRTNSIRCRLYKLQNFLQKYSLTEEKTAIFASLTDVKLFPIDFFDSLLQTWDVITIPQYTKLKELILWLSTHSEQEARDGILKCFSNDEDLNKFWSNYQMILSNMRKDEGGHATEYLLNSKMPIKRQDPEWFEKGVVCKHVAPMYINLYKSNVIDGSWVIDEQAKDCLFLSMDIIKYAYNLLTNYRGDTFKVYQDSINYEEIDPADTNIQRPNYDCEESVFENGWDDVKNLKLFEHFLAENYIDTNVLADLPPDCVVFFIALVYFAHNKHFVGEDVTREVYAVVLSYVMLSLVFNRERRTIKWNEYLQVKSVIDKYYKYDENEAKKIFDGEAMKRFAELQYCIQHMNYLNSLCGSPYETTQYRTFYNGTFVYKVYCDMKDQDADKFVNELFQKTPSVLTVVKRLIKVYERLYAC